MLKLKPLMQAHSLIQADLARELDISTPALAQWINHDQAPKRRPLDELCDQVEAWLRAQGVPAAALAGWNQPIPAAPAADHMEDATMLAYERISPDARRHFGLFRDPFHGEIATHEDVYLTPSVRYVREAMWQVARHGGFVAVVGESGAGKTILRRDLVDRINRDHEPVVVIQPYVQGMADNDKRGQTLRAAHIAEAIVHALAPLESPKRSPQARFNQVHTLLRDSHRAGTRHLLLIEEAHSLPVWTLKHLKRFLELEDGFTPLLGIVLLGQSELRTRLTETDREVREVVQRCEMLELSPLDERLEGYLTHKFQRIGKTLEDVIDEQGVQAMQSALLVTHDRVRGRHVRTDSLVYPLAVNNFLSRAINLAADIGAPRVTADIVTEVMRERA